MREEAAPDSNIDLLIITGRDLEYAERREISHASFDVNLEYGTLSSFVDIDEEKWNSRLSSFHPIHENVTREGIVV